MRKNESALVRNVEDEAGEFEEKVTSKRALNKLSAGTLGGRMPANRTVLGL